ncbi:hypothetical protein AMECASPLE_023813 [Ameca splendens]|uniref:Uncharacterized protein n=1 Tax=Ameca splendens TaxID=208324 RepID=A0ABV0XT81_9TELE
MGGTPWTLPCSSLGGGGCGSPGGGSPGVPVPLDVYRGLWIVYRGFWMSMARISSVSVSGPGGQVCGSSHSLLHICMEKPCIHKHAHSQTHRCLDSGVNKYKKGFMLSHIYH